jgi:HSP20 family molecular chaperone IbpA
METEHSTSESPATNSAGADEKNAAAAEKNAATAGDVPTTLPTAPGSPTAPRAKRSPKVDLRRSTVILAGVAILAGGILVGIHATKYVAGIPPANAATQHPAKVAVAPAVSARPLANETREWNPFQDIRDMQLQMDRMFDQMTTRFRLSPSLSRFVDRPGYSLSLNLRDMKDHYEVRASLPGGKAPDVKVSLLDKQTLKVDVSNSSTQASGAKGDTDVTVSEWGQYSQIIHLPSPVKSERMAIDQPNHGLVVTLPKVKA